MFRHQCGPQVDTCPLFLAFQVPPPDTIRTEGPLYRLISETRFYALSHQPNAGEGESGDLEEGKPQRSDSSFERHEQMVIVTVLPWRIHF